MSDTGNQLAREITTDAERRAERTVKKARRAAENLREEARRRAEREREQTLQRARAEAERLEVVWNARIEQQVAALRRRRHEDAVRRVGSDALHALEQQAAAPEGRALLVRLAAQAVRAMAGESFELELQPEDRERWGDELPGAVAETVKQTNGREVTVAVAERPLAAGGGLVVRRTDGRERADQTFAARCDRLWDELREGIADRLPAEQVDPPPAAEPGGTRP
jgi:vacuolar-type H+-ATPase subunit E/Vma4